MRCIFHFLSALVQAGSNKYIFLHVFCDIMLEHMYEHERFVRDRF